MPNSRDIKRRIKSVTSTQQITKAMKMISATKLRKAQASVTAIRPFTHKIDQMIQHVSGSLEHPYLQEREVKNVCYLVLGSDRGQCGGFNANLNRFLKHQLETETRPYQVIAVGRKVRDFCRHNQLPLAGEYIGLGDLPHFNQSQGIAESLRKQFDAGEFDEINIIYSHFKSSMSQIPTMKRLLPISEPEPVEDEDEQLMVDDYIFEPSAAEVTAALLPQYVDVDVFCALQEAKASEHGARMTAMSSATDNASEMIGSLTLSLNRARQAAITTEISEIVGGAAALS